jgi:hypothetical protein
MEETKLSRPLHEGTVPLSGGRCRRTAGRERCRLSRRLPRGGLRSVRMSQLAAITAMGSGRMPAFHVAFAGRDEARMEPRLCVSQASLNSCCRQYQAKELVVDDRHVACKIINDACQEYEELSGFAMANVKRKALRFALARPPHFAKPRRCWGLLLQLC